MRDSAVLTTAMSSISIAVAAQTTTRVQRWMFIKAPREGEGVGSTGIPRVAQTPPLASGNPLKDSYPLW